MEGLRSGYVRFEERTGLHEMTLTGVEERIEEGSRDRCDWMDIMFLEKLD